MDIGIRTRARTMMARFERTPPPPATQPPATGKPIRLGTAGAVVAVAAFAAIQSFTHIYWLAHTHQQDHLDSALLPLTVDGLIFVASLVMLYASRTGRRSPLRARAALWLGIAVTVAANVAFGIPAGIVGALVSAWPALAFVIAVELLMVLMRMARSEVVTERVPDPLPAVRQDVPAAVLPVAHPDRSAPALSSAPRSAPRERAQRAVGARTKGAGDPLKVFADEVASGALPSLRSIRSRMHVGADRAKEIHALLETARTEPTMEPYVIPEPVSANGNGVHA